MIKKKKPEVFVQIVGIVFVSSFIQGYSLLQQISYGTLPTTHVFLRGRGFSDEVNLYGDSIAPNKY